MRGGRLSYRRRRKLLFLTTVAVVAGGVATAVILVPKGDRTDQSARSGGIAANATAVTPTATKTPPQTRPSAADRKRIISTISLFIGTAVVRHHPERAFDIVDASLREGMTKQQWSTGAIPVVPFPAIGVDLLQFDRYTTHKALVEVFLEPAKGSHLVRKTFQIELHRRPPHRWLVSSWVPEGVSQSQIDLNRPQSPDVIAKAANPPHLSATWIYLPLGLLLVGLLFTPVALFTHHALQTRRAEKRYRESLPPDDLRRYAPRR